MNKPFICCYGCHCILLSGDAKVWKYLLDYKISLQKKITVQR